MYLTESSLSSLSSLSSISSSSTSSTCLPFCLLVFWSMLSWVLESFLAVALAAALVAALALALASSLYKLLTLGLTPCLKALASGRLYQDFKHLFALMILALRRLRELVIRCLAELNTRSYLALISSIANILRVNWASSGCEKYSKFQ